MSASPAASTADRPEVRLFTDGACKGNPGPGGWAFILQHIDSGREREASGGEASTTNNRMELTAVIEGLTALERLTRVELVTDSVYVAKGCAEWLADWKRRGWRRREGQRLRPIKNEDLWRRLDELLERHHVCFRQVAGHSGHAENERCDELAVAAAQRFADG